VPDGGIMVGGVAKLTIEAFTDAACTKETGDDPIVVLINPENYSQSYGVRLNPDETIGSSGKRKTVDRECGEALSLQLILDGTGAVPSLPRKTVAEQVLDLRRVGLTLTKKQLNYLLLTWGTLRFKCRLKSLKVTYTLFNPDGSPLRASVAASFDGVEVPDKTKKAAKAPDDGGQYIMMEGGEDLSKLCARIYGDAGYMLDVASRNQLDSFRKLPAGEVIYFPPLSELRG